MDSRLQMLEKSTDSSVQDEASQSIDTSFVNKKEVENPTSSSVTHNDVEAIQALESTDTFQTSAKSKTDSEISSTRVFPDVPFDSESGEEIESSYDVSSTREVPDVPLDSESGKESLTGNQTRMKKKLTDCRIQLVSKMFFFSVQCWNPSF